MPRKSNAPAHKGEGATCLLGRDTGVYSTAQARIKYLADRLALPIHRAAMIAPMAFGVVDHG